MMLDPEPYIERWPGWLRWLIFLAVFGFGTWAWYQGLLALIEFMRTF